MAQEDLKFRILAELIGGQAVDKFKNQLSGIHEGASKVKDTMGQLKTGLVLLAEAFMIREAARFAYGLIEMGAQLDTLSEKTGIAVKDLSGFKVAAELSDLSLEKLEKGLIKFNINMAAAASGNTDIVGTFKKLGVTLFDNNGKLRQSGDLVKDLADKFRGLEDGAQKTAVAQKLFGKSGADMIPFLNSGKGELERYSSNISDDYARRAQALDDTLVEIKAKSKGAFAEAFEEALPTLQQLCDLLLNATNNGNGLKTAMSGVAEVMREAAIAVVSLSNALEQSGKFLGGVFATASASKEAFTKYIESKDKDFKEWVKESKALTETFGAIQKVRGGQPDETPANVQKYTAKEAANEIGAVWSEYVSDFMDTQKDYKKALEKLKSGSLLLADGTNAEIKGRVLADTKPPAKRKTNGTAPGDDDSDSGKTIDSIKQKISQIQAEANAVGLSNTQREKAIFLAELEAKGITRTSSAYRELAAAHEKAVTRRERAKENEALKDYVRNSQRAIELRRLELSSVDRSSVAHAKLVEHKKNEWAIQDATKNMTRDGAAAHREAAEGVQKQNDALGELEQAQKESYGHGAKQAIKDYVESVNDSASQMKSCFSNAFGNLEDALMDFTRTGKLNFTDFANSIISDLQRIAIRQAITGPLVAALGDAFGGTTASANGNVMTSSGPLPLAKYSKGGIAHKPQLSIFGEGATPEAYVPLPDGRTIPVTMKGQTQQEQGSTTSVVVNVSVESGEQAITAENGQGKQLGAMISQAVVSEIVKQKRPGGILA